MKTTKSSLLLFLLCSTAAWSQTYSPPTIITRGGTYVGHWESLHTKNSKGEDVPAINIQTKEPVIIENSKIRSASHCIHIHNGYYQYKANVIIRNTECVALRPTVEGISPGRFVNAQAPTNLRIENNSFDGTSGILVTGFSGDGSASQTIKILRNKARNINGAHRTIKDYRTDFAKVSFVQFRDVLKVGSAEIAYNEVINEVSKSRVEDNINIYNSNGVSSTNPIRIHNNLIRGAYPIAPFTDPWYSGGGILTDGKGTGANATAFVHAYDNVIIGTGNYKVGIAVGNNNRFYNNRCIASSYAMVNGTLRLLPVVQTGIWMRDYHNLQSPSYGNNQMYNNVVGVMKDNGVRNDWGKLSPTPPVRKAEQSLESYQAALRDYEELKKVDANNTRMSPNADGKISFEMEEAEHAAWRKRLADRSVRIGVLVPNRAPVVSFKAPLAGAKFPEGQKITAEAQASDPDGRIVEVQFLLNGVSILRDATAPYTAVLENLPRGLHTLRAVAKDDQGATANSEIKFEVLAVTQPVNRKPFHGTPFVVPSTTPIQAEDFDEGAQGVTYFDADVGNNGGKYRSSGVDIQSTTDTGGGFNVGWTKQQEWLEYTIDVKTTGTYALDLRVAATAERSMKVLIDGVDWSGTLVVPNTGGTQVWRTITKTGLRLTAGQRRVRILITSGGFNINHFRIRQ